MTFKIISATEAKPGINIIIDGSPCNVKSQDISKTGKHGHAKVRMDAIGIFDDKKRVIVVPGHERFEVPMVEKRKAQVLSMNGGIASVMDLESFETLEMGVDESIQDKIKEEGQVEYWKVNENRAVKRIL